MVEHTSCDQEVMGSNPAGCWGVFFFYFYLFLLSFTCGVSLTRSLMCWERKKWMPSCAVWGETGSNKLRFGKALRLHGKRPSLGTSLSDCLPRFVTIFGAILFSRRPDVGHRRLRWRQLRPDLWSCFQHLDISEGHFLCWQVGLLDIQLES